MNEREPKPEIKKGLKNVYIDKTKSSFIDGKQGKLIYRGYNIHDLASKSTFEEIVYLLINGDLPDKEELNKIDLELKSNRQINKEILSVIQSMKNSHPMDVLRTCMSLLSASDSNPDDISIENAKRIGFRITAILPTIVTTHHRLRNGQQPIKPNDQLTHAENFLYMLSGEIPDPRDAKLIDKDLILHAEHGVNASSFAARVAASTRADFYSSMTAAISTLKGPLHGGAAEGVMKMTLEIGNEENASDYVAKVRQSGGRVMGFGHAVYKAVDPRSVHLKDEAKALGERLGQPKWFSILEAVTKVMEPYARRGLYPNVDFWAGAVYYLLEIPEDLFIPLFAMGRIPGWTIHIIEQYESKGILRPRLYYDGPMDMEYKPIEDR